MFNWLGHGALDGSVLVRAANCFPFGVRSASRFAGADAYEEVPAKLEPSQLPTPTAFLVPVDQVLTHEEWPDAAWMLGARPIGRGACNRVSVLYLEGARVCLQTLTRFRSRIFMSSTGPASTEHLASVLVLRRGGGARFRDVDIFGDLFRCLAGRFLG